MRRARAAAARGPPMRESHSRWQALPARGLLSSACEEGGGSPTDQKVPLPRSCGCWFGSTQGGRGTRPARGCDPDPAADRRRDRGSHPNKPSISGRPTPAPRAEHGLLYTKSSSQRQGEIRKQHNGQKARPSLAPRACKQRWAGPASRGFQRTGGGGARQPGPDPKGAGSRGGPGPGLELGRPPAPPARPPQRQAPAARGQ